MKIKKGYLISLIIITLVVLLPLVSFLSGIFWLSNLFDGQYFSLLKTFFPFGLPLLAFLICIVSLIIIIRKNKKDKNYEKYSKIILIINSIILIVGSYFSYLLINLILSGEIFT